MNIVVIFVLLISMLTGFETFKFVLVLTILYFCIDKMETPKKHKNPFE